MTPIQSNASEHTNAITAAASARNGTAPGRLLPGDTSRPSQLGPDVSLIHSSRATTPPPVRTAPCSQAGAPYSMRDSAAPIALDLADHVAAGDPGDPAATVGGAAGLVQPADRGAQVGVPRRGP